MAHQRQCCVKSIALHLADSQERGAHCGGITTAAVTCRYLSLSIPLSAIWSQSTRPSPGGHRPDSDWHAQTEHRIQHPAFQNERDTSRYMSLSPISQAQHYPATTVFSSSSAPQQKRCWSLTRRPILSMEAVAPPSTWRAVVKDIGLQRFGIHLWFITQNLIDAVV